jgi:pyruvate dehydrogenase E1 component alpha subunit
MFLMRRFEEAVADGVADGRIHGEMHLGIGQESVAAALQAVLQEGDALVSTHRAHLHALAIGVDPVQMLAELFERDGLNHGFGGHMHLFDPEHRFMCTGIVGASAPLATGYALAQRYRDEPGITIAVAGDGAMNQGAVFESMNLAAVLKLPMLFLVEDNAYSISVPRHLSTAGVLSERGEALGLRGFEADGRNYTEVARMLEEAVGWVRDQRSPAVAVAEVYRFRGHYEGDTDLYRSAAEKEEAMSESNDPLLRLRSDLLADGISEEDLRALEIEAADQVTSWLKEAADRPLPDPQAAKRGTFVAS